MPGLQNAKTTLDYLSGVSSQKGLDKIVLSNSVKALFGLGQFLIKTASENLTKKGHVATGNTIKSMEIVNVDLNSKVISLDVQIQDTYKFIDQGVKGTRTGKGKYAFKTEFPNKKMATALLKWIRIRGAGGKVKYTAKGTNEAKNKILHRKIQSSTNLKSMAYGMAVNIKKHGIERTLFFTSAVQDTVKIQKDKIGSAFKLDIIQSLS